ncbi:hypothetical protein [Marivirga sericea]|nr:hypothetical protein [Marivirga sericea]
MITVGFVIRPITQTDIFKSKMDLKANEMGTTFQISNGKVSSLADKAVD